MRDAHMNLWKSYGAAAASGLLMMASMPGYDLWFLAWVGLVPLLLALRGRSSVHQYLMINVACIIWSIGTHGWYPSIFSGWGYLVMIAGGLYYGAILKMGYDMSKRVRGWYSIFSIPAAFSVWEWIKTVVPFTKTWWIELLPKSQWTVPENLQLLSITGFIGLSFLILLTNVSLAEMIERGWGGKKRPWIPAFFLLLPFMNYGMGYATVQGGAESLAERPITIGATVDLANQDPEVLALGNAGFAGDGYVADTDDMKQRIFDINSELSRQLQEGRKADFIVWGENEFMNLDDRWLYEQVQELSRELGTTLVVDSVWNTDRVMYDTAVMIDSAGEELGRTPKIFTLWGEEEYGFSPGPRQYAVYDTEFGKAALAVCWDRHDPSILRNYAKEGARLVLIPADDDFGGDARFPVFAASDAVFRAVENRIAIGSGSTSGMAQVITPYGEVTAASEVNERQFIVGDTFVLEGKTFYTNYGDAFAYLLSACFVFLFIGSERNKRRMK